MHITEHAKLRYVQRILDIPVEKEAKRFMKEHEEEITKKIRLFYMESKLFFKNLPLKKDGGDSRNIYLHKDVILLLSHDDQSIITLYRVITSEDEEQNIWNIHAYLKTVQARNEEIEKIRKQKKEQEDHSRNLEFMRERLKKQLAELETEIEESIGHSKELYVDAKKLKLENYDTVRKILYGFRHAKPKKKTFVG